VIAVAGVRAVEACDERPGQDVPFPARLVPAGGHPLHREQSGSRKSINLNHNETYCCIRLSWSPSYDRELQCQRCKIYNATNSPVRVENKNMFLI
jgi:hypothetical protein